MAVGPEIFLWLGLTIATALIFMIGVVGLIIIAKKTHAIIEFKSSMNGTPLALFFQDNRYCDWKNTKPDAGMVEDKEFGSYVIDSTYIDKKTKNVLMPFNSSFAMSLNVKAAKMADDLIYMFKEQNQRKKLKKSIIDGHIPETDGIDTLRTSVNFSTLKHFVSPILPHSVQSKIANTVALRLKSVGKGNLQNIVLLAISALGAIILGGLVLKFVVFP